MLFLQYPWKFHPHLPVWVFFWNNQLRDCQQITFIMLNRFCLLSRNPHPPVLNGQYQDGWNTNQKQMKNAQPFYTVFQVLKVLLIKIYKIQPPDLLFLVVLYGQVT